MENREKMRKYGEKWENMNKQEMKNQRKEG